ncbi:MAG: ABC transporter ATP-binding protein [Synergistaceae bacterium]|nr:ABC transporter ATP-binding protein [Synergistaceae bacterium]
MSEILSVRDLCMSFYTSSGEVKAVDDVSFDVNSGEVLGIVGESGSGKSATMLSIMGLAGSAGRIKSGRIIFRGQELNSENIKTLRGKNISMIFQDPMTSLNPVLRVGYQLRESLKRHNWQGNINSRVIEILERVGIVPAAQRVNQYPYEFSGGQRQRIMTAMAVICNPELLIADEPTTALDVTVQAQILRLMRDLRKSLGMSMILISHDLGVIAGEADRVIIMYGCRIMERGTRHEIFYQAAHPYTKGLLRSVPNIESPRERLIPIEGSPPDLLNPPKGCPFVKRCPDAMKICLTRKPEESAITQTHKYSCWLEAKNNA